MNSNQLFRKIPRVDDLIRLIDAEIKNELSDDEIKRVVNDYLLELRNRIENNKSVELDKALVVVAVEKRIQLKLASNFIPVINATGVVIHTNLGRSTISHEILKDAEAVLSQYSNLEFNLETGIRGTRYAIVESLICNLTGAEAALVVNNNAAAVMLVLNTLAKDREVIVSRGELVEIGGAFRIPDVMQMSQCQLVEVGTTNKTHLYDYENAVSDNTALLLKVHTSNYKILGFTATVNSETLAELGKKKSIPVYEDLGSGLLIDLMPYGFSKEPIVKEVVQNGVDVVSFSGDKLLGASQCGIIVGRKELIDKMKKNQLLRALRIDKFSLAILEQTLKYYWNPKQAIQKIDTLRRLTLSSEAVRKSVELFWGMIEESIIQSGKSPSTFSIRPVFSEVGGGSYPLEKLESYGLYIKVDEPSLIQAKFRSYKTPIIVRIVEDEIVLDFRTLSACDFETIRDAILEIILRREQ